MLYNFKFKYANKDDVIITVDSEDCKFINGYYQICFLIDDYYYSGLIDESFNIIIPFSCYKKDDEKHPSITVFKNDKAIYGILNKIFYLIDLKNAKFKEENNYMVPVNPIMVFEGFDDLDDMHAIILKNEKYFVLDVSNFVFLSWDFDYIKRKNDYLIATIYMPILKDYDYAKVNLKLSFDGVMDNKINTLGMTAYYSDDAFVSKDKLAEEIVKSYNLLRKNEKCEKIMQ